MSSEAVAGLLGPEFYFRIKCMYDMLSMRQGVDPDRPPTESSESPQSRMVTGSAAVSILSELAEIRKNKNPNPKEGQ